MSCLDSILAALRSKGMDIADVKEVGRSHYGRHGKFSWEKFSKSNIAKGTEIPFALAIRGNNWELVNWCFDYSYFWDWSFGSSKSESPDFHCICRSDDFDKFWNDKSSPDCQEIYYFYKCKPVTETIFSYGSVKKLEKYLEWKWLYAPEDMIGDK